jgi:tetratricopeptide (TPR) repeat protein
MLSTTPDEPEELAPARTGGFRRWPGVAALLAGIAVVGIFALAMLFIFRPDPDRRMLDEIDTLMASADWQEAEALCRRRIAARPAASRPGSASATDAADTASSWTRRTDTSSELDLRLAVSLSMLARYEEAAGVLDQAIARSPRDPRLALNRALVDYRAGNLDGALARLRQLSKDAPYAPNVSFHIGRICEAKGLYDDALGAYRDELNVSSSAAAWERYFVLKKMRGATTTRPASMTQP